MKPTRPIVITGFMGCGKSGVARELARRLNVTMADLDESITEKERRTPARIIVEDGEPAFRHVESNMLRELLENGGAGVIALGGGAWIEETNRRLLAEYNCLTVWLKVPFEICWARITASGEDRPLGKTREQARALYNKRRPVYEVAEVHIRVKARESLDALASRIEAQLTGFQD